MREVRRHTSRTERGDHRASDKAPEQGAERPAFRGVERAEQLGLQRMVAQNREMYRTDFTVSVDAARGVTTGISAYDRAIKADPKAAPAYVARGTYTVTLTVTGGVVITSAADSLLAKVIAFAGSRAQATARMRSALERFAGRSPSALLPADARPGATPGPSSSTTSTCWSGFNEKPRRRLPVRALAGNIHKAFPEFAMLDVISGGRLIAGFAAIVT